jgi:hypothetical protein
MTVAFGGIGSEGGGGEKSRTEKSNLENIHGWFPLSWVPSGRRLGRREALISQDGLRPGGISHLLTKGCATENSGDSPLKKPVLFLRL